MRTVASCGVEVNSQVILTPPPPPSAGAGKIAVMGERERERAHTAREGPTIATLRDREELESTQYGL